MLGTALLLVTITASLGAAPPSLDELQSQLDRDPTDTKAWVALGHAFEQAGREADATRAFRRAGDQPEAHRALSRFLHFDDSAQSAKDLNTAIDLFEKAGDSKQADQCRREFIHRLSSGNRDAAIKMLSQMLSRNAADEATARDLPKLFDRCGRPKSLMHDITRFAERNPQSRGAQFALASAQVEAGQTAIAAQRLRAMLEVHPDADGYQILARALADQLPELLELAAQAEGRDVKRSRAILEGVGREPAIVAKMLPGLVKSLERDDIQSNPYSVVVNLVLQADQMKAAEPLLNKANAGRQKSAAQLALYESEGRYEKVLTVAHDAPNDISDHVIYSYEARALMHLNREADAIAAGQRAVDFAGDQQELRLRLQLVEAYTWFGLKDGAAQESRRVLDILSVRKSDDEMLTTERIARTKLASLAQQSGEHAVAEAQLHRVLELAPNDLTAHNDLGYYWAERGQNLAEAERLCRFAIAGRDDEEGPGSENPAYLDSLGWVLFRQGRLTAARFELERALAAPMGRRDATIWDHLGDVLWAQGKLPEAKSAWTEATKRFRHSRRSRDDARPANLQSKLAAVERRMKE